MDHASDNPALVQPTPRRVTVVLDYAPRPPRWGRVLALAKRIAACLRMMLLSWGVAGVLALCILLVPEMRGLRPWDNLLTCTLTGVVGWAIWFHILRRLWAWFRSKSLSILLRIGAVTVLAVVPFSTAVLSDPCPHARNIIIVVGPVGFPVTRARCSNYRDWKSVWGNVAGVEGITNW